MSTESKLKKIVKFEISNRTNVKVLKCCYLVSENQEYFKNGKPKGSSYEEKKYYFFVTPLQYTNFIEKNKHLPVFTSYAKMIIDEGRKYDKAFLLKNLNKI